MRNWVTILSILFICNNTSAQADAYKALNAYIPDGYSILDSASGDLNKDGFRDLVVILKYKYEEIGADTTRTVLILGGGSKKLYKLLGKNDSVTLCKNCGGVFGDPYAGLTIKGGYFSIEHYGGSNWRWTRIMTFKYDTKSKGFILHRDAGISYHIDNEKKQTDLINNKEDFGKLPFEKYSYEKAFR